MDLRNFNRVQERIDEAAQRAGRNGDEVTLVAVSKSQPPDAVEALYEAGHRDFGENRANEMAEKAAQLPADIRWHFVGSLQSNKTRLIRNATYMLHSLDRESLAGAWAKGIGEPPPVLIEVNVGQEDQKGGVAAGEVLDLVRKAHALGLRTRGLMAIPPLFPTPEESRPFFILLREIRDRLRVGSLDLAELSMGMTNDFEVAIEEGASLIRVGRAIFGSRHL